MLLLGTLSPLSREIASCRIRKFVVDPSQLDKKKMEFAPFVLHMSRTFITTSPFHVQYLGRSLTDTITLMYVSSRTPRQFCNA